jgi:hypothetical protein
METGSTTVSANMGDAFEIESVGCSLSLEEVYDRVEFEPLKEPEH